MLCLLHWHWFILCFIILATVGALLFFALLGLSGCFITCYDRRVRNDLAQPCRELCLCCCHPGYGQTLYLFSLVVCWLSSWKKDFFFFFSFFFCYKKFHISSLLSFFFFFLLPIVIRMCADCHLPGTLCMWTDCATCCEGCASTAGECGGCLGGAGEAGLPLLLIMGLIVLGLFTIIGIFYSVLVATMVGQRIWQRHYHILAKRMLTKVNIGLSNFLIISPASAVTVHCLFLR